MPPAGHARPPCTVAWPTAGHGPTALRAPNSLFTKPSAPIRASAADPVRSTTMRGSNEVSATVGERHRKFGDSAPLRAWRYRGRGQAGNRHVAGLDLGAYPPRHRVRIRRTVRRAGRAVTG